MKKQSVISKLLLLLILTFFSATLVAQEAIIPFCDNVRVVDANLGKRISFFKPYTEFQQATLSRTDDGYIVSITHKSGGIFQTERKTISQADLDKICLEISTASTKEPYQDESASQEARRRLIIASTSYSLGYYSWALPLALGADDGKAYVASYMLIGGGGFFIPLIATRNKDITNGMAGAYTSGAGLGILHGYALAALIEGGEPHFKTFLGLSVGLSMAESFVGLGLAKKYNYSWGRSSIIGSGGFWGLGYGTVLSAIILEFDEPRVNALSALAVSGLGMWGANSIYKKQTITHGDVTYINTAGLLASYVTSVALNSLEIENARANASIMLAGASAGLWYGINKTKHYNYNRQQGNLIATGSFAGGLIGAGIGVLVDANANTYLWLTSLGAVGGFALTDMLVKETKDNSNRASSLKLNLNPFGLVNAYNNFSTPYKPWDPRYQNSIVNLNYTF